MHKKLAADLTSLAHSILQMKNKEDVIALQKKAHEVYEKLSILAYVDEYIKTTPNAEFTKEELLEKIESANIKIDEPIVDLVSEANLETQEEILIYDIEEREDSNEVIEEESEEESTNEVEIKEETQENIDDVIEKVVEEIEDAAEEMAKKDHNIVEEIVSEVDETNELIENEITEVANEIEEAVKELDDSIEFTAKDLFGNIEKNKGEEKVASLEEELKDTISVDVVANLFDNVPKKSLNDKLQGDIQIGLNDRIAFVKNLFGGSQEDFNRVVSQLNTFKTEKEAKKFINKMVKPDYDWSVKEEFEERFMAIVERKFT